MTIEKEIAINAVRRDLLNAEDNLNRAKHAPANWKSGNGDSLRRVINAYQKEVNQLRQTLEYLEGLP